MAHRRKAVEHLADDALRRRVGGAQRRVRGLQGLQFLEQAVVLGVGQLRRVEHVVAVSVVLQLGAQRGGLLGQRGRHGQVVGSTGHRCFGRRLDGHPASVESRRRATPRLQTPQTADALLPCPAAPAR